MEEADIQQIKVILKGWNKFPANAEADFDCLCNEVSTALGDGFGATELTAVIQNEFVNHFGEPGPVDEVLYISEVIVDWWQNKSH